MDILNSFYQQIVVLSKESPIIAGLISLWGMTVVTFLLRNVPTKIVEFISRQITTSLEFNNAGWGANERQFESFMKWYANSAYFKWSRYLSLDTQYIYDAETKRENLTPVVGPGYGKHFFFFNKRLYWFVKSTLESSGSDKEKQMIKVFTFGRKKENILMLIDSFKIKPADKSISIYTFKDAGWNVLTTVKKRNLNSVILNKEMKDKIVSDIDYFYKNPEWYNSRGLSHKQTYILHGQPGTGKSSSIKALASYFEKNICVLDMDLITGSGFEKALATAPKGSFILLEDFDSCSATQKREDKNEGSILEEMGGISLSKILNVLDGVISLDGTLIFMTTNHLGKLDPALIRTGRVDYIYEVKPLEDAEVKEYIGLMYGAGFIPLNKKFKSITGSDIQAKFLEAKDDVTRFVNMLEEQ